MSNYRLDKTYFRAQSFQEADEQKEYWLHNDVKERLGAAWYLISCAYGFNLENPPRLDKSIFSMRKHPH
jgi:hypothetical protein